MYIMGDDVNIPPLAFAVLVLLLIILIVAMVPGVGATIIDILGNANGLL
jgi:hypothetical protein